MCIFKSTIITTVGNGFITFLKLYILFLYPGLFSSYVVFVYLVVSFLFSYASQCRKIILKIERLLITFQVRLLV